MCSKLFTSCSFIVTSLEVWHESLFKTNDVKMNIRTVSYILQAYCKFMLHAFPGAITISGKNIWSLFFFKCLNLHSEACRNYNWIMMQFSRAITRMRQVRHLPQACKTKGWNKAINMHLLFQACHAIRKRVHFYKL